MAVHYGVKYVQPKFESYLWDRLRALDETCFPSDDRCIFDERQIVLVVQHKINVIAYLTIEWLDGFVSRVGVHPNYRGKGFQRRLVRAAIKYARKMGFERLHTYTQHTPNGALSALNFIASGFKLDRLDKRNKWVLLTCPLEDE